MNRGKRGISLGAGIALITIITIIGAIIATAVRSDVLNFSIAGESSKSNAARTEDEIKIGDYVEYTPKVLKTTGEGESATTEEVKSYTISKDYSGHSSDQTINRQDNLTWRVLNINYDNYGNRTSIDLISASASNTAVTFAGAQGYNNEVYLLNDLCKNLYGNSNFGATARCLSIEDIKKVLKDKSTYENYSDYGKSHTYSIRKTYPSQYKNLNTAEKESESGSLIESANATGIESSSLAVTSTWWDADANTAFITAKTAAKDTDNIYYNLFNSTTNLRLLASRFASCATGSARR